MTFIINWCLLIGGNDGALPDWFGLKMVSKNEPICACAGMGWDSVERGERVTLLQDAFLQYLNCMWWTIDELM